MGPGARTGLGGPVRLVQTPLLINPAAAQAGEYAFFFYLLFKLKIFLGIILNSLCLFFLLTKLSYFLFYYFLLIFLLFFLSSVQLPMRQALVTACLVLLTVCTGLWAANNPSSLSLSSSRLPPPAVCSPAPSMGLAQWRPAPRAARCSPIQARHLHLAHLWVSAALVDLWVLGQALPLVPLAPQVCFTILLCAVVIKLLPVKRSLKSTLYQVLF